MSDSNPRIQYGNFTVTTDYSYCHFRDPNSIIEYLDHLRYDLQGGSFNKEVRENLGKRMVQYAQAFLEQGHHNRHGVLSNSITYDTGGRSIMVEAKAPYSGHIEYGFRSRGNKRFVGPFPYLRPALQIVSAESRDLFSEYMESAILNPSSKYYYRGLGGVSMGRSMSGSNFQNLGNILLGNVGGRMSGEQFERFSGYMPNLSNSVNESISYNSQISGFYSSNLLK